MMKIFLIGYMACGKSHLAREMATAKNLAFIDLDAYIVKQEKRSIREIFREQGETEFRKMETFYLQQICQSQDDFVMATGGGAPCFNENMAYMNGQGHTIFLNTDLDTIVARLDRERHCRPIVAHLDSHEIKEFVTTHLNQRLPFYRQAKEIRE